MSLDLMSILKALNGGGMGSSNDTPPVAPVMTPPITHGMPIEPPEERLKPMDNGGAMGTVANDHQPDVMPKQSPLVGILGAVANMANSQKQQTPVVAPQMQGVIQRPEPIPYQPMQYQPPMMRRY